MRYFQLKVLFSITALIFFGYTIACFGQTPLTITFDGAPPQPRGTEYNTTYYQESGLVFTPETDTPGDAFARCGGGISFFPENGSAYLQSGVSLVLSFTNGLSFNLQSVDLAGYSDVVPEIVIDFVGYRLDRSLVTNSFSGSGIDFKTYNFGPEFTNVTRVEVFGYSWSLDNLVVQPVPVLSITMEDFVTYFPPGSENLTVVPAPLLSFSTVSNRSYALEFSPDLSPGSWTPLPGPDQNGEPASNIVGDGSQSELLDTNAIAATRRFYRVRALQ